MLVVACRLLKVMLGCSSSSTTGLLRNNSSRSSAATATWRYQWPGIWIMKTVSRGFWRQGWGSCR